MAPVLEEDALLMMKQTPRIPKTIMMSRSEPPTAMAIITSVDKPLGGAVVGGSTPPPS